MEEILAMQIGLNADQVKSFTINRFQKLKKDLMNLTIS